VGTLKILIVEDDFLNRNYLSRIVSKYGDVDVAVDGTEAVEAVRRSYESGMPYDLLFLDIMLPQKDGLTALHEIRAIEESLGVLASDTCKAIMTTALGDAKNVMRAFGSQCEAYITKPFSKESIDEQIRKLIPA
jgi:two-component system, chemotaxis family, chemotaxis protein CheY